MSGADDIHEFLDGVVSDIYKYNQAFVTASEKGEISFDAHHQLSKLRKDLFGDIVKMEKVHKLSDQEKELLPS